MSEGEKVTKIYLRDKLEVKFWKFTFSRLPQNLTANFFLPLWVVPSWRCRAIDAMKIGGL